MASQGVLSATSGAVPARYAEATAFLRCIDDDWAQAVNLIGSCVHEPKAAREPWEALVRAVAYQQLTAKAGDAMLVRLKALAPDRSFPDPALIAAADPEVLRRCGFSAIKVATIQAIAAGVAAGSVPSRAEADALSDRDLVDRLSAIRGIGRWTVEMLLIYSLERPDVLPADDFGVREGYRRLKSQAMQPGPAALRTLSAAWAPYRTVATWYLWRLAERGKRASQSDSSKQGKRSEPHLDR